MESDQLARERAEHDELYSRRSTPWLDNALTWDRYRSAACVPPHEGGSLYGFDVGLFVDQVASALDHLPTSASVLDYGCGRSEIGILAAQRGFSVTGFDLSPVSTRQARAIAEQSGVDHLTTFLVANAQSLPFRSEAFDLVLGKQVLHHVIKYSGTNLELARVMKPGARALFLEGAAANPLIRWARRFTIDDELGDVPLTVDNINEWTEPFDQTEISGYLLFYMLKRLGFRGPKEKDWNRGRNSLGRTEIFDRFLKVCFEVDKLIVNEKPWGQHIAGRYLVEIQA